DHADVDLGDLVLGHVASRIQLVADLDDHGELFADRVEVHTEADLGSRSQQPTRALRVNVAVLPHGKLTERFPGAIRLDERRAGMMHHTAGDADRFGLDCLDPHSTVSPSLRSANTPGGGGSTF